MTSQGNPDLARFEKATAEFAEALRFLGFEVAETISMANGGAPDAVMERKDLLDKAKSAGLAF